MFNRLLSDQVPGDLIQPGKCTAAFAIWYLFLAAALFLSVWILGAVVADLVDVR